MTEAYKIAKEKCSKVKNYSEDQWKKRLIATELLPGDKVLVKNNKETGGPGELRAKWEQEVYTVIRKLGTGWYMRCRM